MRRPPPYARVALICAKFPPPHLHLPVYTARSRLPHSRPRSHSNFHDSLRLWLSAHSVASFLQLFGSHPILLYLLPVIHRLPSSSLVPCTKFPPAHTCPRPTHSLCVHSTASTHHTVQYLSSPSLIYASQTHRISFSHSPILTSSVLRPRLLPSFPVPQHCNGTPPMFRTSRTFLLCEGSAACRRKQFHTGYSKSTALTYPAFLHYSSLLLFHSTLFAFKAPICIILRHRLPRLSPLLTYADNTHALHSPASS
ncbi:hypothetical protein C8R43DRAFT_169638 [Mycena crocata]|nr:hypothetical protein C8R43DRAFT_169638 [Mycena crocata]